MSVLQLVIDQNSADNDVRRRSELTFKDVCATNPSQVAYELMDVIMGLNPVDIIQSCLLHLKRMVPRFWSMAFPAFTGNPINQELKSAIRSNLLQLISSTANSKIRNGASYCIVQIAAADYPDEWPDLLQNLYQMTQEGCSAASIIGGLTVLNDLFDDLITEDQFWDDGIGSHMTNHLISLLSQDTLDAEVKTTGVNLYQTILNTLQSPESFNDDKRKSIVYQHVKSSVDLFNRLLSLSTETNSDGLFITQWSYRASIYNTLASLVGNFNKKIAKDIKYQIAVTTVQDLTFLTKVYDQLNVKGNLDLTINQSSLDINDPVKEINGLINEASQVLLLLQHTISLHSLVQDGTELDQFWNNLLIFSLLNSDDLDRYQGDINEFVSDTSGLSGSISVRDSINEFVTELNSFDSNLLFQFLVNNITTTSFPNWAYAESNLYLLEAVFQNTESVINDNVSLVELLAQLTQFISLDVNQTHHPIVTARLFLLLPKFFEKFENKIATKDFGIKTFVEMVNFTVNIPSHKEDDSLLVKASALISCPNYDQIVKLSSNINGDHKPHVQLGIFQIIASLLEECEEDGLPMLLEALTVGIDIDQQFAASCNISESGFVTDLVLKISFKDPANVQLALDSSDCFKALLENLTLHDYISCCEKSLPFLFDTMEEAMKTNPVEYSPQLDLSLELLGVIIESVPASEGDQNDLPDQIFLYIYPVIKRLLLLANDDQILQNGGSVFNELLQHATQSFLKYFDQESGETGMQSLLTIVSKFLSPALSDRAAMNCGTIVTSLINKFRNQLSDEYLTQIIGATTERLVFAKEIITIENLVMLFCNLVLISPEAMVNFLSNNFHMKHPTTGDEKSGLELVLPIWFQSFEVTRGYEKIRQNALALGKIFSLGDERIELLIVNGDIIPYEGNKILTRSMTKSMPERYTQISAAVKILKLLVGELEFQCQQPNAEDYLPDREDGGDNEEEGDDEGDDDGWEDLEDIGVPNYDKLKSYVDSDEEDDQENSHEDLKNLLVQFFKECASKNLGHFLKYYEQLSDEDKKIITENVLF